jgi:nitrite reductase/ring-hydroxylating ferredoxin subunit
VAAAARLICDAAALRDAGDGVRFEIEYHGERAPAFVVRHRGRVYAYLNRCAHVAMELDWRDGQFFDLEGRNLICSTHGALYAPASGRCLGGPCAGKPLLRLRVEERDGRIYYLGVDDG